VLLHHLARMFMKAGEALAGDSELRAEINQGFVVVLKSFVARSEAGRVEFHLRSGQGLGYGAVDFADRNQHRSRPAIYPFHGSLIGGLAGLTLYSIEFVLRWCDV